MKLDKEQLYLSLPIPVQNALCSIEGWRISRQRYSKAFYSLLKEYEDRASWTQGRLREYRDRLIHKFVKHCEETVPYYRNQFQELGICSEDIRTLEDLRHLPILTKQVVQERYPEFVSENITKNRRIIVHTSGTTGGGLRFATTLEAMSEQWALWWRYRRWHGITLDTLCGYFGGRSVVPVSQQRAPFWRYNRPGRQILFSGYHMSSKNLDAYVAELNRQAAPWLHGYPSLLSLLASYLLDKGETIGYQVRWITTGAESLLPYQMKLIEEAFGVRPLQHYGLAEAVANISQCKDGILRVDEDFSAVEFLRNPDGPGYKIVGTNFSNPATPLLRYDSGDLAETAGQTPDDQVGGRIVETLDGRQEDYILLSNGARLGRMDHIFKDLTRIREAQLYQSKRGEVNIRVVRGKGYRQQDEKDLLREFRKRVGSETTLEVEYVDELPRSPTGKLRFVISDIPTERIS